MIVHPLCQCISFQSHLPAPHLVRGTQVPNPHSKWQVIIPQLSTQESENHEFTSEIKILLKNPASRLSTSATTNMEKLTYKELNGDKKHDMICNVNKKLSKDNSLLAAMQFPE